MRRLLLSAIALVVVAQSIILAAEQEPFPPIGDRYKNVPGDAKAIVKSLKKLEARTEIGIDFKDYEKAVAELYADTKVFIESAESESMPELRILLRNAIDCHMQVREAWGRSLAAEDGLEKYEAKMHLIDVQSLMWKASSLSATLAKDFVERSEGDLAAVQQAVVEGLPKISVATLLVSIRDAQEKRAIEQAKEDEKKQAEEEAKQREWELELRQSRAQASGHPIPAADEKLDKQDLASLLFQKGELGEGVCCSDLKPVNAKKLPPANLEGQLDVYRGEVVAGSHCGYVLGFLYADAAAASDAYELLRSVPDDLDTFGNSQKSEPKLGNAAAATESSLGCCLTFRRGGGVVRVHLGRATLKEVLAYAKQVDSRLARVFPDAAIADARGKKAELDGAPLDIRNAAARASEIVDGGGESARHAKTLLALAKTNEWKRKNAEEKPIKGVLVKITDEGAVFETQTGEVVVPVPELSAESGGKVSRMRDLCRRILAPTNEAVKSR
jgi:hypothetical protein